MKKLAAEISKIIEKRQTDLNTLFSKLIQAKSENPPGDTSEAAEVVASFLKQEGINYQTFEPEKNHVSVVATIGQGKPNLIFCGHIDVVPAGDPTKWEIPPYAGKIKAGKLLGRGTSDQKGGVAAMLMAIAALKDFENELSGKITVASVSDEEAQGPGGTHWLLENKKLPGKACIITEATGYLNDKYTVQAGEKGNCWLKITAHGKSAHGSTPASGINAIEMLTEFLPKLRALGDEAVSTPKNAEALIRNGEKQERRVAKKQNIPLNSLARTLTHYTLNIGVISGGTKVNIVPDRCEAEIDIRVPAGGHPDGVEEFVRSLLPEELECQVINKTLPSYTPTNDPLIKQVQNSAKQAFGYTPAAIFMPATSDAHYFREQLGIPTVAFGPGYSEVFHAYNEFVYLKDVKNAAQVYANVIANTAAKD